MSNPPLTPSPNRSRPPPFHEMDADAFERMTCALVDKIPEVTRADLYATQRQPQYGIDVFGEVDDGLIVASCKCYSQVKKDHVREWSDDFLNHWEGHWRLKNVRRFVLVVAAPMNSHQRLSDIEEARKLFDARGVAFDVWAPAQIQERLRDQPGIVSTYLGVEFVERLCGRQLALISTEQAPSSTAVSVHSGDQLDLLIKALSGQIEERLKRAREDLERGYLPAVEAVVAELRESENWKSIEPRVQAQAVRLQASLAIERGDLESAGRFAIDADALEVAEEPRLRALLTFYEKGADAAITVLGEPETDSGRRLLASFLLHKGLVDEADIQLGRTPRDGEYFRLRTYALLLRGQANEALKSAQHAEELQGDRLAVMRIGAIARYASALTPLASPLFLSNPQPLGRGFVRSDARSVAAIGHAEATFARLAEIESDPAVIESDQLWRLACLSNLEGRLADAEALCALMLAENPMHIGAIAWGVSRNLSFERQKSLDALLAGLKSGAIPADGVRAIHWLWPEDDADGLTSVLRTAFENGTGLANEAAHELEIILNRLTDSADDDEPHVQMRIMEEARATDDWRAAEALFDRLSARGGFEPGLLYIAEDLASVNHWDFINARRDTVLSFGTASAVRLAIFAAINAGDASGSIKLIDQYKGSFPGERLPFDIRRVEAAALNLLGEAPLALDRAVALAAESASPSDRLLEAQLRVVVGDHGGAAPALRRVLAEGELHPRAALHWAGRFAASEPQLAKELWRSAVKRPLDDHTSVTALHLSFRLGLEDERPDLFGALHRVAATDSKLIRVASIDDVVEELHKGRERQDHINRLYQIGAAPIHVLVDAANGDLPALYTLEKKPPRQSVYLRHGARDLLIDFGKPIDEWRFRIDLTGLLVSDAIGLLDKLEQLPLCISVSHDLPQVLAALEDRSHFHQPSRVVAAEAILRALDNGEISKAAAPPSVVRVAYEPADAPAPAVNFSALLIALRTNAAIDPDRADAIVRLPTWSGEPFGALEPGAPLLFEFITLESVAEAGLLEAVTRLFDVFIDDDALKHFKELSEGAAAGAARARRLAALRTRVTAGIGRGIYRLLPIRTTAVEPDDEGEPKEGDPSRGLVENLLGVMTGAASEDMVWVDDRHVSGYPRIDEGFVVGIVDVLQGLRANARIDAAEFFGYLRDLRAGGALFIPMDVEEVRFHLSRAPLIDGDIGETPGLEVLRRSFALGALNEPQLKTEEKEPELKDRPLETPFILSNRRLADNTIYAVWQSEPDIFRARAESSWIWSNLRLDHMRHEEGDNGTGPFAAMNVAGLLARAMFISDLESEERLSRPRAFVDWINETAIEGREEGDAVFYRHFIEGTRQYILSAVKGAGVRNDEEFRGEVLPIIKRWLLLLPERLQAAILANAKFRKAIDFKGKPVVTLNDIQVHPRALWRAALRAVRTGTAKLKSARGEYIEMTRSDHSRRVLHLTGAREGLMEEPALAFLDRDSDAVRAEIGMLFDMCDVPHSERAVFGRRLRFASPHRRMQLFHKAIDKAVSNYLADLADRMGRGVSVNVGAFAPPTPNAYLRYLDWPNEATMLAEVTAGIIQMHGANRAFDRLSGLPMMLGDDLYTEIGGQISGERLQSPMHGLHALAAAARTDMPDDTLSAMTDQVMQLWADVGPVFIAILLWTAKHFEKRDDWQNLDSLARHAVLWTSADQLTRVFVGTNSDPKFAANFFEKLEVPSTLGTALTLLTGYDDTALDPGCVRLETLFLFGLVSALPEKRWRSVMTQRRKEKLLDMFGTDKPDGGKTFRPMREQVQGDPNWFSNSLWRDREIPELPDADDIINRGLAALEANPVDRDALIAAVGFGLPALREDLRHRIDDLVNEIDEIALSAEPDMIMLRLWGEAASRLGTGKSVENFLGKLLAIARVKNTEGPGTKDVEQWLLPLLEAAAAASKMWERDRGEKRMTEFVCKLIGVCPAVALPIGRLFEIAVENCSADKSARMWRVLLTSRLI